LDNANRDQVQEYAAMAEIPEGRAAESEPLLTEPDAMAKAGDKADPAVDKIPGVPEAATVPPQPESSAPEEQPSVQGAAASARATPTPAPEYAHNQREVVGAPARRPSRLQSILVWVLVVLTCVGTFASTVTVWAHQTVLNTDRFVSTLKPVINDPQFINTVSDSVADQVNTAVNVQQRVTQALPPQQAFLAVPLTTAFLNATSKIASSVLSSEAFQRAWPVVLGRVHGQLVALLRGDTKNVVIENNQLVLNLFPVITRTLTRLQAAAPGLIKFKAPLPTDTEAKQPSVARQQLSQALGRPLPSTFGTVVLASSSQLDKAQQAVKTFDVLVIAIPVITLVLAALALLLSRNRRRTVIAIGIGLAIAFVLALVLIGVAKDTIYGAVKSGTASDLVHEALPKLLQNLQDIAISLAVVGALVAACAYLAGRPPWLMRLLGHGTQPVSHAPGGSV
jgi:hypothetical protein